MEGQPEVPRPGKSWHLRWKPSLDVVRFQIYFIDMKIQFVWLVVLLMVVFQPNTSHASLCDVCKEKFFIQSIGTCSKCNGSTSSGAFKLCKKCSDQLEQCEACEKSLKAKAGGVPGEVSPPVPPVPKNPGPKNKAYPAHWGAPPRIQTKDLRPLPGGYGMGSSTLKGWIQKNLDQDAKAAQPGDDKKITDTANAAEIQQVEKKIAEMEDLATRARFTEDGLKKHQEELAILKERLKVLKGGSKAN